MELLKRGALSWRRWTQQRQLGTTIRTLSSTTQGIAESGEGPKAVLGNLLSQANKPLTSGEIWESVENKGFKSKRYMKQMLKQMRLKGHINTKPLPASGKKQRSFGYFIASTPKH